MTGSPSNALNSLAGGLIVSCQALAHEPLHGSHLMAAMATAAVQGGAVGIRANSPADIAAIKAAVDVPVIGLWKDGSDGVFVTPTAAHAVAAAEAGADIVALDGTARPRPDGAPLADSIRAVHARSDALVLADVSTLEEGIAAVEQGADAVASTLSGYTAYSPSDPAPDYDLVRELAGAVDVPVVAEGRIGTPAEAHAALAAGAFAVVVGGAITRPQQITETFVRALHPDG